VALPSTARMSAVGRKIGEKPCLDCGTTLSIYSNQGRGYSHCPIPTRCRVCNIHHIHALRRANRTLSKRPPNNYCQDGSPHYFKKVEDLWLCHCGATETFPTDVDYGWDSVFTQNLEV
jgi:hypothetical protein